MLNDLIDLFAIGAIVFAALLASAKYAERIDARVDRMIEETITVRR
jgi:hypothetical protein